MNDVERGINVEETVVLSQHPSETTLHLVLRILGYCLVIEEGAHVQFGPWVCVGDAPDVVGRDLTGQISLWMGCGDVPPDLARKVVQHNRDALVHVVMDRADRVEAFVQRAASWSKRPRGWAHLKLWLFPTEMIEQLAAIDRLRQEWVVTLTGDHCYLEVDGVMIDGPVKVLRGPGEGAT